MCDERVFEDDVSEALVVHLLKDCELVRSFDPNHIQQVKPEMLKLVWVQIYDVKVLSDAYDHLVKGHRALGILFDQFRCQLCMVSNVWGRGRPISVASEAAIQKVESIHGFSEEFVSDLIQDGEHMLDEKVLQILSINLSVLPPAM